MTDRAQLLADIAHHADALTDPWQQAEPIHDIDPHRNRKMRRVWITTQRPLLEQLAAAVIPGESYSEGASISGGYASRPPARLDAVDRLLAIEAASARWCLHLHLVLRATAAENIRGLVGAAGNTDADTMTTLAADVRAWQRWAATVTGWEQPAWAPPVPCPICAARNTLRVRLATHTACCLACGEAWGEDNIGLLADHIRSYQGTTSVDTAALRATAVANRRAAEARYGTIWHRPDLPYVETI